MIAFPDFNIEICAGPQTAMVPPSARLMRARPDLTRMSTPLRSSVFTSLPTTCTLIGPFNRNRLAFNRADHFALRLLGKRRRSCATRNEERRNENGAANEISHGVFQINRRLWLRRVHGR